MITNLVPQNYKSCFEPAKNKTNQFKPTE